MELKLAQIKSEFGLNISSVLRFIAGLQKENGDIPWYKNGKTDPWDLVETAMGLNIGRCFKESYKAFEWLKVNQNRDGSWYSSYVDSIPEDRTCETNMSAYVATGVFHTWLINKDTVFLERMWETVKKGIDFALSLQTGRGEIYWAKSPEGEIDPMCLLAGSSSVYMSLKCALSIASALGKRRKVWEESFIKLGQSINQNIQIYNISKSRYSMYWFYPILCGVITQDEAEHRIRKYWKKYVIEDQGARCVSDQPWVTIAETSELVISLVAMGNKKLAQIVFSWIQDKIYEDESFWCGYTYPDMVVWPEEKISWTNAVVIMAADALYSLTPASGLFNHSSWNGFVYKDLAN